MRLRSPEEGESRHRRGHHWLRFRPRIRWGALLFSLLLAASAAGQTATVRGQVFDQSGAVIPKATVVLTDSQGRETKTTASSDGSYSVSGLEPGLYRVQATAPDLVQEPVSIDLRAGTQSLRLELHVATAKQQVTIRENSGAALSTDSSANASALVLSGKDLNALADDPEDLAADLQALAGPSAGPDGSSLYIDGFSGGELPPKDAIREIRINQNPFSPEYDKLGYGRVEVLTKPGANKFHGGGYFNFGDSVWNSRNPYAAQKAPFLLREYGASLEGPLRKSASFFLATDGTAIDNGAIINGATLDPATLTIIDPYTQVFTIPQLRIRPSVRIDDQLTSADTVSLRYQFADADIRHSGIGGFDLTSMGVHNHGTDQSVQFSNLLALGTHLLNETRFQFYRAQISNVSDNPAPQLQVLNAFAGGGSQVGDSSNLLNTWEVQNYVGLERHRHMFRLGIRLRAATMDNTSPIDFGGTFTFAGRTAPELDASNQPIFDGSGHPVLTSVSSIEAYRRTLLLQNAGLSASQVRSLGGGASQFMINAGNPTLRVDQEDIGVFGGDTWRLKRNLTLDYGLRYEWQTNLHDRSDFAPRLGLAWAPAFRQGASSPRTVIRAGFGVFYQRFDIVDVLTARRYNGADQQSFVVSNPDFFPSVPAASALAGSQSQQAVEQLSSKLRAPYLMESAVGVERQLPAHSTLALTWVNSHGLHQFLTNDINAPLPGTWNPAVPGSGTYPLGAANPVFLVESSGRYNQNELVANVNAKITDAVSLFGSYVYNRAMSNTDYSSPPQNTDFNPAIAVQGFGVGSFPADPWNLSGEYGPASTDIHHQVNVGGTMEARGLRLSPLFVADSGAPFNITAGQDLYGTTLFNGRPGIATDSSRPGLVRTSYGLLDPNPIPGEVLVHRNSGRGPGITMFNLRLSEVFAFGPAAEGSVSAGGRRTETGPFGGGQSQNIVKTGHRYSLAVSLAIRNLLNHNNPGPIIGNITSPLFGRANQPYGVGSLGGTGFSESADNRRLEFQTRLTF